MPRISLTTRALAFFLLTLSVAAPTSYPQTAYRQTQYPTKRWTVALPATVGLDAGALAEFDKEIAAGKYGYVDSFLVIRRGKMIFDRSYRHDYQRIYGEEAKRHSALNARDPSGPYNYFNSWWHPFYRRGELHTLQSVTKTITSVIIGVAIARGDFPSIETPVMSFFDAAKVASVDERKRRLTVRHLLTMTGGFDWNENLPYNDPNNAASQMEASGDWVEFAVNRPMAREPGTLFNYSSGESQLLAHIFRRATGRDIEEYAARHLFAPLGITDFYWKRTPSGLVDTEGGLYLNRYDLAKIWYLFLQGGVWEGKQVVTPEWVKDSVKPSVAVRPGGPVKYGFKWWLYPYGENDSRLVWAGSGFGGQIPLVLPELDMVAVFTGWNVRPDGPRLSHRVAIDRLLRCVTGNRSR